MGSLYANTGCDLDLILYKGTGSLTTEIFDDTGTDIGAKYTSGSTGYDLGFIGSSGQDIGRILGGDVMAIWRSNRTSYSDGSSDPIDDAWHMVTMFSSDKSKWNKVEKEAEALTIGRHKGGSGLLSKRDRGYGAYAYHLMANGDGAEMEITLGSPTSSDGKVWINEIRSPNAYTKNFVIVGYGGNNTDDWYESGYTDGNGEYHSGTWHHDAIMSSITLYIKLKVGGLTTKSYSAKLNF